MKLMQWMLVAVGLLVALQSHADEAAIRKNMGTRFPGSQISSISKTPYAGLYEMVIDGQIVYSDDNADYLFMGSVLDTRQRKNLTEARLAEINLVNLASLPLNQAIKFVKGDGSRTLYVFTDPKCPYCKQLEQELTQVNNVTIYDFPYPIESLHPGTTRLSKQIWCAKNRNQAWQDALLKGAAPANDGSCKNPVADNIALGNRLHVTGTPTLVFANGERVAGVMPVDKLDAMLTQVAAEAHPAAPAAASSAPAKKQ